MQAASALARASRRAFADSIGEGLPLASFPFHALRGVVIHSFIQLRDVVPRQVACHAGACEHWS